MSLISSFAILRNRFLANKPIVASGEDLQSNDDDKRILMTSLLTIVPISCIAIVDMSYII